MKQTKLLSNTIFFVTFCVVCMILVLPLSAKPKEKTVTTPDPLLIVNSRIDSLEQDLNETIDRVNRLSGNIQGIQNTQDVPDYYGKQIAKLDSSTKALVMVTASISQDIAKLKRQISQSEQRAVYIDSINFEILSQLVILENRIVSLGSSLSETRQVSVSAPAQPAVTATGNYRDRYLQALTFHQNGDNEKAIELFRQLLEEDRYHELADNAQYWIGECYYTLKQYRHAIVEFEKVFAFKQTNKDDDAQFKIGLCYVAIGDREKAIDEFQRLVDYYPQSEFVKNAQQLMK